MNAKFEQYTTYVIGGAVIITLAIAAVIAIVNIIHGNVHVASTCAF